MPCRWEGDPLITTELTPPAKEATEPTSLRFGFHQRPKTTAARIARTLGCKFEQEKDLWVTSDPELITITPEPAGGCLITVELTTRPHQLTVTLGAVGIEPIRPYRPEGPTARDG